MDYFILIIKSIIINVISNRIIRWLDKRSDNKKN